MSPTTAVRHRESCPVCADGVIGFRRCDDLRTVVSMCRACDAAWLDAGDVTARTALHMELSPERSDAAGVSVYGFGCRWATATELRRMGWLRHVAEDVAWLGWCGRAGMHGPGAFVYSAGAPDATALEDELTRDGTDVHLASPGPDIAGKDTLLEALARTLHFPSTFGSNWDALADCLQDLSWLSESRVALVHTDLPALPPDALSTYLDVLADAVACSRSTAGQRLCVWFPDHARARICDAMRIDEAAFWGRLEHRALPIALERRPDLEKGMWCDGFIPRQLALDAPPARVTGEVWMAHGGGDQALWSFTLLLGDPTVAVVGAQTVVWSTLLPSEDCARWVWVDVARERLLLDPHGAVAHDPDGLDPRWSIDAVLA